MTPAEIYTCIKTLPTFTSKFLGIIPSTALTVVKNMTACDTHFFLVLTNISHDKCGHYIVLTCNNMTYELFDPLSRLYASYDTYVSTFINSSKCKLIFADCQPFHNQHCAIYCVFYIYLRACQLDVDKCIHLLKSFNLLPTFHNMGTVEAFSSALKVLKLNELFS
jgi:hypothetical protein